ncbi:MAG: hypothetical protein KGN84_21055, partial [Acidobacteriota bacterium]|nr:hypothetical protein [Acidobacteriota bacterium]
MRCRISGAKFAGAIAIACAIGVAGACAQTVDGRRPEFAVASVKAGDSMGRPEIGNSNGRSHARNATLRMILATAYQVPVFEISGGPGWVDSEV